MKRKSKKGLEKLALADRQKFRQEESKRKASMIRDARKDIWKLKSRGMKILQQQEESEPIKELKDLTRKGEKIANM